MYMGLGSATMASITGTHGIQADRACSRAPILRSRITSAKRSVCTCALVAIAPALPKATVLKIC